MIDYAGAAVVSFRTHRLVAASADDGIRFQAQLTDGGVGRGKRYRRPDESARGPGAGEVDPPVQRSSGNAIGGLLHADITRVIIGAMYDVHNELGAGFLESVYANALAVVLRGLGLRVERNVAFDIIFRGVFVGRYVADLVVESTVVVETKVARAIEPAHCAQLRNYLRAAELEVGLVLNFGASAQFKRVVWSGQR